MRRIGASSPWQNLQLDHGPNDQFDVEVMEFIPIEFDVEVMEFIPIEFGVEAMEFIPIVSGRRHGPSADG